MSVPFEVQWHARLGQGSTLVADFDGDGADDILSMYNAGLWINIEDWFVDFDPAVGATQTLGLSTFETGVSFDSPPRLIQVAGVSGQSGLAAWAKVGYSAIQSQVALLMVHDGRLQGAKIDGRPGLFGKSFALGGPPTKATSGLECLDGASRIVTYWAGKSAEGGYVRTATTYELAGTTYFKTASEPFDDEGPASDTTFRRSLHCPPPSA